MDVPGGNYANEQPLWLWECTGTENQQFLFEDGTWHIAPTSASDFCIDAGDMSLGNPVMLWQCNDYDQQILGYDASAGSIFLRNSESDASMCLKPEGNWNSAKVVIGDCSGEWRLSGNSPAPAPYPHVSGLNLITYGRHCLDIPGNNFANGQPLWIWECAGTGNQQFLFSGGSSQIFVAGDTNLCLDAGEMDLGASIMLWECNDYVQQRFGYDKDMGTIYLANSEADASLCVKPEGEWNAAKAVLAACDEDVALQWGFSS